MDVVYFSPLCFFKNFSVPPTVNPPKVIFISPARGLLSLTSGVLSWLSFRWYLYGSIFLTYFCNFPCQIKVSTWSFKCLHSSVQCPWSWWNLQYLLLSFLSTRVLIGFGHCKEGSSLICIRTCSIGIIRGVKLVKLGFLFGSSFFFPMVCLPFVSPFSSPDCYLFLRLSSFSLSSPLQPLCPLHSCTSELYGVTLLLFLVDF